MEVDWFAEHGNMSRTNANDSPQVTPHLFLSLSFMYQLKDKMMVTMTIDKVLGLFSRNEIIFISTQASKPQTQEFLIFNSGSLRNNALPCAFVSVSSIPH